MKKKIINNVFGKNIYLLGQDKDGINYWLESPSWDCAWYWGFGYVETYTNNRNPAKAKDITLHTHLDSVMTLDMPGKLPLWKKDGYTPIHTSVFTNNVERLQFKQLVIEFYGLKKRS